MKWDNWMKAYNNTKLIETLPHLNISLVQRRPNVFDAGPTNVIEKNT